MPYQRVGAMKISDHHVQSPLLNIDRACQTCHRWPEAELRARVETIQDRTFEVRNVAMDALMALISDLAAALSIDETRRGQSSLARAGASSPASAGR